MAALLALLAAVGWGSSDYAAGSASRRSSAVSVVILTHFAAVIALAVLAIDFGPMFAMLADFGASLRSGAEPRGIDWGGPAFDGAVRVGDIGWGLAAGVGGGLGAMLLFRGLGRGSMAVVAPITAAGAATIPAVVGIAGGESASSLTLLGIVLALVAIVLISATGGDAATGRGLTARCLHCPECEQRDAPTGELPVIPLIAAFEDLDDRARRLVGVGSADWDGAGEIPDYWAPTTTPYRHPQPVSPGGCEVEADSWTFRLEALDGGVDRSAEPWSRLRRPGVSDALLSGLGFGAFFVFISRASDSAGYWPLVSARSVSVALFAIAAIATGTTLLPARGSRRRVVVAGLLDAAAAACFVLSTRTGLLSVGAVLASLYPGITVLLARLIDHERIQRSQLVGLALAVCAASLLAV